MGDNVEVVIHFHDPICAILLSFKFYTWIHKLQFISPWFQILAAMLAVFDSYKAFYRPCFLLACPDGVGGMPLKELLSHLQLTCILT